MLRVTQTVGRQSAGEQTAIGARASKVAEPRSSQVIQQERLRALGAMASGIAHDFNNALAAILGFTELLIYRPENLVNTEKTLRYF